MTTSGNNSFRLYRDEIILAALRKVGNSEPTSKQRGYAASALDIIVKDLSANYGFMPWKMEWATKKFSAASEVTGTDGNIYTCIRSHTSAAGNAPVTGDDYTSYWIQRGSTGGTWASGASYTSTGDFAPDSDVVGIEQAFWRLDGFDFPPLGLIDRQTYFDITNKTTEAVPERLWFDLSSGTPHIYLDFQLDDLDRVLHYRQVVNIEDNTYSDSEPDLPQRRYRALVYSLAVDLADEYDVGQDKQTTLYNKAEKYMKAAKFGDRERTSSNFIRPAY